MRFESLGFFGAFGVGFVVFGASHRDQGLGFGI